MTRNTLDTPKPSEEDIEKARSDSDREDLVGEDNGEETEDEEEDNKIKQKLKKVEKIIEASKKSSSTIQIRNLIKRIESAKKWNAFSKLDEKERNYEGKKFGDEHLEEKNKFDYEDESIYEDYFSNWDEEDFEELEDEVVEKVNANKNYEELGLEEEVNNFDELKDLF